VGLLVGSFFGLALAGAGCAALPIGRFDALAAATRETQNRTAATDADVVQLSRRFMIFSPAPGPYTASSFVPRIEIGGTTLDFDFGPRLAPREAALAVLAGYATALAAFARKDYQGDLDAATQALAGSVHGLVGRPDVPAAAKQGAGVLATVVDGIGRAITERMRRAALRDAMDTASPGVRAVAGFVKEINAGAAQAVLVMRQGILTKANHLAPGEGTQRVVLNERVEAAVVESEQILSHLTQISTAVDAIPPAHDQIRKSLDGDERAPLDKLATLVAEVQRLGKIQGGAP
jgi:hypothetical protein